MTIVDLPGARRAATTLLAWAHQPQHARRDSCALAEALTTLEALTNAGGRVGHAARTLTHASPPDAGDTKAALRALAAALHLPLPAALEHVQQLALDLFPENE